MNFVKREPFQSTISHFRDSELFFWRRIQGALKYTYVYCFHVGHKSLTISEEAYNALASLKREHESFTEAILRLTRKAERGTLLDYVRSLEPDEEFAAIMEEIREREKVALRAAEF